ncbi:hypothetical protein SAZ10_22190 [Mesorhizobium sp. BAC0120]|uniref:hypothetical protein n=1 Tax=Mesorhizobium sp. BAC0120 TaxID=3090670 RepID=UPI00298C415B|nr:hypothetical protein [Mesorhizobium sp. BAC0120]MDW6024467.1 hypothetical protein [Mesorhizobium sp. BAC0120]
MHNISSSVSSDGVSRDLFVSFVRDLLGSYPNPDEQRRPGPWDPIVRAALARSARFGPHPDPWLLYIIAERHPELWDLFGGDPLSLMTLNPQPLPPHIVFATALADELMERAAFAQGIADWLPQQGEEHGIIIVGGRVLRYVDELCGNNFKLKFPRPVPPPPWWREELSGSDLVTMGVRFESAAKQFADEALGRAFGQASEKLVQAGIARFQ